MPIVSRIRDPAYQVISEWGADKKGGMEGRIIGAQRNLTRGLGRNPLSIGRLTHKPDRDGCRQ